MCIKACRAMTSSVCISALPNHRCQALSTRASNVMRLLCRCPWVWQPPRWAAQQGSTLSRSGSCSLAAAQTPRTSSRSAHDSTAALSLPSLGHVHHDVTRWRSTCTEHPMLCLYVCMSSTRVDRPRSPLCSAVQIKSLWSFMQVGGKGIYLRNALSTHVTLPEISGCGLVRLATCHSQRCRHISTTSTVMLCPVNAACLRRRGHGLVRRASGCRQVHQ